MAGSVRIDIKDNKIELGPMKNEIIFIAGRIVQDITKGTTRMTSGCALCDVIVSPRTPK